MSTAKYTLLSNLPLDDNYDQQQLDSKATSNGSAWFTRISPLTVILVTGFITLNATFLFKIRNGYLSPFTTNLPKEFLVLDEDILKGYVSFERPLVSLGILASLDDTTDKNLKDFCDTNSIITCYYIQSDVISSEDNNTSLITHIILAWNGQLCHITVFREAGEDALFVKKIVLPEKWKHLQLSHGLNGDEAYSKFSVSIMPHLFMDQPVNVPTDIPLFLREKRHAQFIDCNRETAQKFRRLSPWSKIEVNTKMAMTQMKRLMNRLEADVWLTSGSLLGWYRECQAIEYTTDADFATWATNANPEFEDKLLSLTARSSLNRYPYFRIHNIFGKFDMGYEANFLLPNNFKSDLFFIYKESGNRLSSSGHVVSKRLYYKYFYPSFSLCSAIFLGIKINVPCDPNSVLTAEYGNWRTPITDDQYDYKSSPNNRGPAILYPPDMYPAVRTY